MATIINYRDVLIESASPRYSNTVADNALAAANTAIANAATAQSTANTAVTNAATANAAIAVIADDNSFSSNEKSIIRKEWNIIVSEKAGLDSQISIYTAIGTELTAYDSAFQALGTYLNAGVAYTISVTTPPSWINDANLSTTTAIVGSTFRATFKSMYDARQALLNRIAVEAGKFSLWNGVSGSGKPSDNATAGNVLINAGNVSIVGNTITKTSGTDAVWTDASFYSRDGYSGGAYLQFTPVQTNKQFVAGLSKTPTASLSYTTIDYCFLCDASGNLYAYELGTNVQSFGAYSAGDVLAITYDGVTIRYNKNGVVIRSVVVIIAVPLYADSSFYNLNASVSNVVIAPLSSLADATARLQTRQNLIINSTFDNGFTNWTGNTSSLSTGNGLWGQVATGSGISGTGTINSTMFVAQPNEFYTITGDSLMLGATGGNVYFDILWYNASFANVGGSGGNPISTNHDFSATDSNRSAHAIAGQAPATAAFGQARFVWSSITGSSVSVGCRQIKVERGGLPATQYTADATITALQTLANTTQTTANNALTSATSANTQLTNIASDNILSPSEKPPVVQDYTVITGEQAGIDAQATALGITTEKTAYDNAVSALTTYLGTLSGWNTIPGSDVAIVGTTFRSNFANVYSTRQTLLNKIAAVAATLAVWNTVSSRPANIVALTGAENLVGVDSASILGFNPSFSLWASSYPDGWSNWNGSPPAQETTTVLGSKYSVKYAVTGVDQGMTRSVGFSTALPAGAFIRGSCYMNIPTNTGTSANTAGYIIRLFTNSGLTTYVDTQVVITNSAQVGWQKMNFTAGTANLSIYGVQIYQLASYGFWGSGARMPSGSVVLYGAIAFEFNIPATTDQLANNSATDTIIVTPATASFLVQAYSGPFTVSDRVIAQLTYANTTPSSVVIEVSCFANIVSNVNESTSGWRSGQFVGYIIGSAPTAETPIISQVPYNLAYNSNKAAYLASGSTIVVTFYSRFFTNGTGTANGEKQTVSDVVLKANAIKK